MGKVYLGRSVGGQLVAVKVIRREVAADPQFRARFRREVAAAQKVNGLYTAYVVDADAAAEEPWLATAYIDGPSLAEAVRERGPLSHASVARLGAALAEGLSKIHDVGLVHRDLKPSNVLLARDGPRIIDFGIAWSADTTTLTPEDRVVGSPGYMSPEQAESEREGEVGPPSDIFSLGAVLCYAATGRGPWGSGSTATLVYRAVHEEPNLGRLPSEIAPLVAQCLAKNPTARPVPGEILDALDHLERTFYGGYGRPREDYWRHLSDLTSAEDPDLYPLYPFQPRGTHAGHTILGRGNGAVLVEPEAARDLRSAAEYASRDGRDTGGLVYGCAWRDDEGTYLVVEGFLEASPRRAGKHRATRGDAFTLSAVGLRLLREDAARMYAAVVELGWWRTLPGPGKFGPRDFATQGALVGPGGVGLLVFGSGHEWGTAYLGPDGQALAPAVAEPGEDAERRTATLTQGASSPRARTPDATGEPLRLPLRAVPSDTPPRDTAEAGPAPATAGATSGPAAARAPRVRYAGFHQAGRAGEEAGSSPEGGTPAVAIPFAAPTGDGPGAADDQDGLLYGETSPYVPVVWPAPVAPPGTAPGARETDAPRGPGADAGPEPTFEPAPTAVSGLPPTRRRTVLTPTQQPAGRRVISPVAVVPSLDRGAKRANPSYVGPKIPTDVKLVVGALVVAIILAAVIIGTLSGSLLVTGIVGGVALLLTVIVIGLSRI
jgi:hypothetical protein